MKRFTVIATPFGAVGLVGTADRLSCVTLSGMSRTALHRQMIRRHPDAEADDTLLPGLQSDLNAYLAGTPRSFDVPIDIDGLTDFQQRVLRACRRIPFGRTWTYGRLAAHVGRPNAARAVGQAMARNPVPLVVPCHRVVGCNGGLTGFSAEQGLELKRWLLDLENAEAKAGA